MRSSLESPGAGEYNGYYGDRDVRASKWVAPKEKKSKSPEAIKLPPVGTYSPLPVAFKLFENEASLDKKRYKPYFSKE
jgi:hypothetical protein